MDSNLYRVADGSTLEELALELRALGGRPLLRYPPSHLLALAPAGTAPVSGRVVEALASDGLDPQARSAVHAHRRSRSEATARDAGLSWDTPGKEPPRWIGAPGSTPSAMARSTGTPTSRYLVGLVAVALVIVGRESGTGTTPNPEHLSLAERDTAASEVSEGLRWLAALEPRAHVEFVLERHDIESTVVPDPKSPNDYEGLEAPWRDFALDRLGLPPGRAGYERLAREVRDRHQARWGIVIFVTRYALHHFAYASDERLVQHFDNGDWGTANLNRVIAHETLHLFGAQDEYVRSDCSCTTTSGELQVANTNCKICAPAFVDCVMEANMLVMCGATRGQIGWRPPLITGAAVGKPCGYFAQTPRAVYWGVEGNIQEVAIDPATGAWAHFDMSAATGAPKPAGVPFGYAGDVPRVVYRGADGHVHELAIDAGGRWGHTDLTAATGAPMAASDPMGYFSVVPRVVYRGLDQHVHELAIDPSSGQWQHFDMSAATGAPPAASPPFGYWAEVARVVYRGRDGHIHEIALDPGAGGWSHFDMSAATGAPVAASAPAGYMGEVARVVYRGRDGHIHEIAIDPAAGQWAHFDMTQATQAPDAASDPFGYMATVPRVIYRADDGHIHEMAIDPQAGAWAHFDMSAATGAPAAGSAPVGYFGEVPRVIFRGTDAHVHEIAIEPSNQRWAHVDLTG